MRQLENLISVLQANDSTGFVQAVDDHVSRQEGKDLEELFQAASRKNIVMVCEGLLQIVQIGVNLFTAEVGVDAEGKPDVSQREHGSQLLHAIAIISRIIFLETKSAPPKALLEVAVALHDNALLGAHGYPALQEEVARLCLEWWQIEASGRERLTPQTMTHLLVTALETGKAASVKRCHIMRTALELFDFNDPTIDDVKRLLLRCAFAPSFIRCAEGRRFLAYLFTLQPAFVKELTAIVKNQIPSNRKSILAAYGEVIYRAWTSATGACLLEVQLSCIQKLMEAAILASTPSMALAIRRVLAGLHSHKLQPGVDRMLLELYEPILFRRMNAPNPVVRRNALEVFIDAFPLRDPEESNEATDARMTEQFAALTRALKDDVPAVRVAAVTGVCKILGKYWEVIPGSVITGYLKVVAADLAFDAASPAVRVAVAEGLVDLLDNPLAHPLLKLLLPKLEPMLYDASAKVRCAFANLLLSLRGVQGLRWHEIVDIQKLLDVMSSDVPSVSGRIQRLLLPSYFPDAETGPAMVAALLRSSPPAGYAFCLYLAGVYIPQVGGVGAATVVSEGPAVATHCLVKLVQDLTAHLLTVPLATEADMANAAKGGKKAAKCRTKRKKGQGGVNECDEEVPVVETMVSWEAILGGMSAVCCGLGALVLGGFVEASCTRGLFAAGQLVRLLERGGDQSSAARISVARIAAALPSVTGCSDVRAACASWLVAANGACIDHAELHAAVDCLASSPAARASLVRAVASAFGANVDEVSPLAIGEEAAVQRGRGKRKADLAELDALEGMSQKDALNHLGLMLEIQSSRTSLISSGTLGRLLPWVEAAISSRVLELVSAVEANGEVADLGDRIEAAPGCAVYLRACMHILLAASEEPAGDECPNGATRDAALGQDHALGCIQQGMEWATTMLLPLTMVAEADALVKALCPAPQTSKPTKRGKVAKGKAAPAATAVFDAQSAMKESYVAAQTCVAIVAEAARLGVISWTRVASAHAATRAAQLLLSVVRRCMAANSKTGCDAGFSPIAVSAVSHAARLARWLSLSARGLSPAAGGARDLDSELAQAVEGHPSLAPTGFNAGEAVALLSREILQSVCDDATGACVAGVKSHFGGLLQANCGREAGERRAGASQWLIPLVKFVGEGILEEGPIARIGARNQRTEQDENAPHGADISQSKANSNLNTIPEKPVPAPTAELLSESIETATVKQIISAARLVKVHEELAGQAGTLAVDAWRRRDIRQALGGVELAQALGFLGVTVRGKSRSGGDSYSDTIHALRGLPEELQAAVGEEFSTDSGPLLFIMLHRKLLALFPPAPRVTFCDAA